MQFLLDYINRKRHNRGFGIQSPSAFYFVTQVLKEKGKYYHYSDIDRIATACGAHSKRHCRMLFRIVNYFNPKNIIVTGTDRGDTLCAMAAARNNAVSIDQSNNLHPKAKEFIYTKNCRLLTGNIAKILQELLQKENQATLIYIGTESNYAEITATAMLTATERTIIIIAAPHSCAKKREWWEEIIKDPATTVTYDLYSIGILLFDKEKQKQHYTLKM